jgi:hypothetical protein
MSVFKNSLIVWKLAAYDRTFTQRQRLTALETIRQLQHRWDREIARTQRSILKKIAEGDDTPGRFMTLVVCSSSSLPVGTSCNNASSGFLIIY